jgi:hypothetical protein
VPALLRALGAYRYEWDEAKGSLETKPRHDAASHFADSFRYLACGYREPGTRAPKRYAQAITAFDPFTWDSQHRADEEWR